MITLKASEDKEQIKKLFLQNGLKPSEKSGCVKAMSGEEMLGYCLFELDADRMTVLNISPKEDRMLADGILRSTIHVGFQRGATAFDYAQTAPEDLFEALGFIKNHEKRLLAADRLFKSCGN